MHEIVIDIWGDRACFTCPESKVERLSYAAPTPSAIRGFLNSIYSKPPEFYWQINKIEIMKPIQYFSLMTNEVKEKLSSKSLDTIYVDATTATCGNGQKGRTQRLTTGLKDVYYRVHASMIRRPDCRHSTYALYNQAERRIRKGQCFRQPFLGMQPFIGYFSLAEKEMEPCRDLNMIIPNMIYDCFNFDRLEYNTENSMAVSISRFNAKIRNGVMLVPPIDSPEVMHPDSRWEGAV